MDKFSELSRPVRIHRDWNRASMCHCGKCDRWEMTIADADGVQTCASCYDAEWLSEWQNYAEAAEKRIAELEAIRVDASQVFKEIGNELGCNPDNESIMMAIDALKEREKRVVALAGGNADLWETMAARLEAAEAKLATPVRLLGEMLLHDWEHRVEQQAAFEHRKIAWDARLAEDKKAILAAGFTFTVEGDE